MKGNRLLTIHLFEHMHHSWQNIREGEERERRARRGEEGEKGEKKKKRRRFGHTLHPRRRRTTKLQLRRIIETLLDVFSFFDSKEKENGRKDQ